MRLKYQKWLKDDYSIKMVVIPFENGAIIENHIVKANSEQTIKHKNVTSFEEAFKLSGLEKTSYVHKKENRTTVLVGEKVSFLIKNNAMKEWTDEQVHQI